MPPRVSLDEATNPVRIWRETNGWTREQARAELSRRLGRGITLKHYSNEEGEARAGRISPLWLEAIGLDVGAQGSSTDGSAGGAGDSPSGPATPLREEPAAPRKPDGARVVDPLPRPASGMAEKRLADLYRMLGSGIAYGTANQGNEAVFDTYAPELARAWVGAAQENKFAARVVRFVESGGAMGELVMSHAMLLLALFYVNGYVGFARSILPGRFGSYHDAALQRRAVDEAERERAEYEAATGAGPFGAAAAASANGGEHGAAGAWADPGGSVGDATG